MYFKLILPFSPVYTILCQIIHLLETLNDDTTFYHPHHHELQSSHQILLTSSDITFIPHLIKCHPITAYCKLKVIVIQLTMFIQVINHHNH